MHGWRRAHVAYCTPNARSAKSSEWTRSAPRNATHETLLRRCARQRQTFTVVLAEIEDALVPAFLVEECVPFTRAVSVISKWGAGSSELPAGMKRAVRKRDTTGAS